MLAELIIIGLPAKLLDGFGLKRVMMLSQAARGWQPSLPSAHLF
jgi:hypothetical protein